MKSGRVSQNDAFLTGNFGMVCGIVEGHVDPIGPGGK